MAVVECTGSYGAGLARYLAHQRVSAVKVNQPDRTARRRRGKTDAVDAKSAPGNVSGAGPRRAWRSLLARRKCGVPSGCLRLSSAG